MNDFLENLVESCGMQTLQHYFTITLLWALCSLSLSLSPSHVEKISVKHSSIKLCIDPGCWLGLNLFLCFLQC